MVYLILLDMPPLTLLYPPKTAFNVQVPLDKKDDANKDEG